MKIKFWGTRGSIPSTGLSTAKFGGNTTCLELKLQDGTILIFDAGTGLRKIGSEIIKNSNNSTINLLLTHSHWDHIQGFPFFEPAYSDKYKIKIYGCRPTFDKLQKIFTNQMESQYFPVSFDQLIADISFHEILKDNFHINESQISFIRNNHPGIAYGFRIIENSKTVVFITDNELLPPNEYNTGWNDFVKFCRGADILIHDAHYLESEMKFRAGYGHSSFDQAFKLGNEAKVKHLIFFHHEPDRSDIELETILSNYRLKRNEKQIAMKIDAAIEGATYQI